jgi:hypothetical protein
MREIASDEVPVRTITHFCITGEGNKHIRIRSGDAEGTVYISGLIGTLDLRTDEGQRLSLGNWDKATDCVWGWLKKVVVDLRKPAWFRDGYVDHI